MLVHPQGRGLHTGARIGQAQQLQEPLDATVVSVFDVKGDIHEADLLRQILVGDATGLRRQVVHDVRGGVLGYELPGDHPEAPAAIHENRYTFVELRIQVVIYVSTAVERHLPFGGHPAHQHTDTQSFAFFLHLLYVSHTKVTPLLGKIHASSRTVKVIDFPTSLLTSG